LPTSLIYSCHSKALNPKLASCLWKGDLGSMKELIWFEKKKRKERLVFRIGSHMGDNQRVWFSPQVITHFGIRRFSYEKLVENWVTFQKLPNTGINLPPYESKINLQPNTRVGVVCSKVDTRPTLVTTMN